MSTTVIETTPAKAEQTVALPENRFALELEFGKKVGNRAGSLLMHLFPNDHPVLPSFSPILGLARLSSLSSDIYDE
jgi:hypothetical protein